MTISSPATPSVDTPPATPTSGTPLFGTVLVANRGEIACRVIRTLRALGIRSVAVYSDADADARHVREADVAVRIGPAAATESYLKIEAILQAYEDIGIRTGDSEGRQTFETEAAAAAGLRARRQLLISTRHGNGT